MKNVAPFGAPRPHTCEGKGKGRRRPRAAPTKGVMAHACTNVKFGLESRVKGRSMASGKDHVHPNWREHGVKVVPGNSLDSNTAQTAGMSRAAAINYARAGAEKLWAGTVTIHANAKTGAHHHGDLESIIFVVKGRARMRWGDKLEFVAEA